MCGRYTLKTHRKKIQERFAVGELPDLQPRYNLGPTQDGLVVRPGDKPATRTAALLRWGLIPAWTKDRSTLPLLINARAETLASKNAFRDSFKRRRCLVVADGFYEWSRRGSLKQPYHFTVDHGEPFAMAGLWDAWHPPGAPPGETIETFAIITTTAN
jgi:putative SOS response-associated peptidase YedK